MVHAQWVAINSNWDSNVNSFTATNGDTIAKTDAGVKVESDGKINPGVKIDAIATAEAQNANSQIDTTATEPCERAMIALGTTKSFLITTNPIWAMGVSFNKARARNILIDRRAELLELGCQECEQRMYPCVYIPESATCAACRAFGRNATLCGLKPWRYRDYLGE
jgi:hypothetical protein